MSFAPELRDISTEEKGDIFMEAHRKRNCVREKEE
jgi:hypothetical protein